MIYFIATLPINSLIRILSLWNQLVTPSFIFRITLSNIFYGNPYFWAYLQRFARNFTQMWHCGMDSRGAILHSSYSGICLKFRFRWCSCCLAHDRSVRQQYSCCDRFCVQYPRCLSKFCDRSQRNWWNNGTKRRHPCISQVKTRKAFPSDRRLLTADPSASQLGTSQTRFLAKTAFFSLPFVLPTTSSRPPDIALSSQRDSTP